MRLLSLALQVEDSIEFIGPFSPGVNVLYGATPKDLDGLLAWVNQVLGGRHGDELDRLALCGVIYAADEQAQTHRIESAGTRTGHQRSPVISELQRDAIRSISKVLSGEESVGCLRAFADKVVAVQRRGCTSADRSDQRRERREIADAQRGLPEPQPSFQDLVAHRARLLHELHGRTMCQDQHDLKHVAEQLDGRIQAAERQIQATEHSLAVVRDRIARLHQLKGTSASPSSEPIVSSDEISTGSQERGENSGSAFVVRWSELDSATAQELAHLEEEKRLLNRCLKLHRDHWRQLNSEREKLREQIVLHARQRERDLAADLNRLTADIAAAAKRREQETERQQSDVAITRGGLYDDAFTAALQRHLAQLMGNRAGSCDYWGTSVLVEKAPSPLVAVASVLAVAELMSLVGAPIPVLLAPVLDDLGGSSRRHVVAHLWNVGQNGQQIVLSTNDLAVVSELGHLSARTCRVPRLSSAPATGAPSTLRETVDRPLAKSWREASPDEPDAWAAIRPSSLPDDYYLCEADPIEAVPLISSEVVLNCHEYGVDTVGDLLAVDAQWLSRTLNAPQFDSTRIKYIQSCARLLCTVRFLKPFDAQVMVSVGVHNPEDLYRLGPKDLAERVEAFLRTDDGRRLMRAATRREMARLTHWLAAVRKSQASNNPHAKQAEVCWVTDGSEHTNSHHQDTNDGQVTDRLPDTNSSETGEFDTKGNGGANSSGIAAAPAQSSSRHVFRDVSKADGSTQSAAVAERGSRFYLNLDAPVVEAPSIGDRTAEKLQAVGIHTIRDLINADPREVAEKLKMRRVRSKTVALWQNQARLMCQVPELRGHDVEFLVACGIRTPDQLEAANPNELLARIGQLLQTRRGKRILRGGKPPNMAEVLSWIRSATRQRRLAA